MNYKIYSYMLGIFYIFFLELESTNACPQFRHTSSSSSSPSTRTALARLTTYATLSLSTDAASSPWKDDSPSLLVLSADKPIRLLEMSSSQLQLDSPLLHQHMVHWKFRKVRSTYSIVSCNLWERQYLIDFVLGHSLLL